MVACGISTPTSITVVATSIWVVPCAKAAIASSLSRVLHLAVDKPHFCAKNLLEMNEAFLRGGGVKRFALFHERADPKGAGAVRDRALEPRDEFVHALNRQRACLNRLPPGGLFPQI